MSTLLIKNIDTLVSCDAQDHVYTNVNLYCENGLIKSIGNNLPDTADTVIDGTGMICYPDRKSTRLNSSHLARSRMPSSA